MWLRAEPASGEMQTHPCQNTCRVLAYTHFILIIKGCDSETKTSKKSLWRPQWKLIKCVGQNESKGKAVGLVLYECYYKITVQEQKWLWGLLGSCDPTLYPAWIRLFPIGVVEHSSMASGSWKMTVGNGSFLSVSTFSLVFSMVWKCWWRKEKHTKDLGRPAIRARQLNNTSNGFFLINTAGHSISILIFSKFMLQ